ncbi:hypothetical protein VTL71DRAFT_5667 [Oculimacula yallundae]|uniref:Uncharacterized protein n=1 Tax=Oculimacula yallundae TaxID=86028 RepID=A0ABR4BY53_9HELO
MRHIVELSEPLVDAKSPLMSVPSHRQAASKHLQRNKPAWADVLFFSPGSSSDSLLFSFILSLHKEDLHSDNQESTYQSTEPIQHIPIDAAQALIRTSELRGDLDLEE